MRTDFLALLDVLEGKYQSSTIKDVRFRCHIVTLQHVEQAPFYFYFADTSYRNKVLNLSNAFSGYNKIRFFLFLTPSQCWITLVSKCLLQVVYFIGIQLFTIFLLQKSVGSVYFPFISHTDHLFSDSKFINFIDIFRSWLLIFQFFLLYFNDFCSHPSSLPCTSSYRLGWKLRDLTFFLLQVFKAMRFPLSLASAAAPAFW